MFFGIKHWENIVNRKRKVRIVVVGDVLYNKNMAALKDGDVSDLWAPVATLTGVIMVGRRRSRGGPQAST